MSSDSSALPGGPPRPTTSLASISAPASTGETTLAPTRTEEAPNTSSAQPLVGDVERHQGHVGGADALTDDEVVSGDDVELVR